MSEVSDYLVVQSERQKQQSSIKAPRRSKCFLVLEEEGRSQATSLYWWVVVHVVLIQHPLRAGQDAKEVCRQPNGSTRCS